MTFNRQERQEKAFATEITEYEDWFVFAGPLCSPYPLWLKFELYAN